MIDSSAAHIIEPNKSTKPIDSFVELVLALRDKPSLVYVPASVTWLSFGQLMELLSSYPSLWMINPMRFEDDQLLQLINTGRVRGLPDNDSRLQELTSESMAELKKLRSTITRKKLKEAFLVNEKLRALTRAMIGIQRASSIGEIEMVLNEALNPALSLAWVRILFARQTQIQNQIPKNVVAFDFVIRKKTNLGGKILFGREKSARFNTSEKQFLKEVTDTTSLALERLGKLDEAETLKQQWEATFDAIIHPLCITTEAGDILRTNRAFSKATNFHYRDLIGKNALASFFKDPSLEKKPMTLPFHERISLQGQKTFEVTCQDIDLEMDTKKCRLWLFQDITDRLRIERQILQSSKHAEIGTIASSIAHELNNPLAGMLSYLQLIRMDLIKGDPLYEDIIAMEQGTLRCRDIINNLLGFARLKGSTQFEKMNLADAINRAIGLIELQTRARGIAVEVSGINVESTIDGQINSITQALCNILQNSIDAITERLNVNHDFSGKISIQLSHLLKRSDGSKTNQSEASRPTDESEKKLDHFSILISDNGLGISEENQNKVLTPLFTTKEPNTNTGLGLTIAYSIIQDHHGELEISSQPGQGTTVTILFPRRQEK